MTEAEDRGRGEFGKILAALGKAHYYHYFSGTVEPVYKGHPWSEDKVAFTEG